MSQFSNNPAPRHTGAPGSNVYTVLAVIAALVLLAGCIFVAVKSADVTGQGNPFTLVENQGAPGAK